jgi:hypothetical protein
MPRQPAMLTSIVDVQMVFLVIEFTWLLPGTAV